MVHPKDKHELWDNNGVVYRILQKGCNQAHTVETARNLGYRLEEHKM